MTRIAWLAVLVALLSVSVNANNGDPLVGRWRLDVAPSQLQLRTSAHGRVPDHCDLRSRLVINLTTVDSHGRLRALKSFGLINASDGDHR